MKKNEKGFMLVETLVVTTLVSTVLIFLYLQFTNIVNNFNRNLKYNSVNNMYASHDIKELILKDQNGTFYTNLIQLLTTNINNHTTNYLEILTTCDTKSGAYNLVDCENFKEITDFYEIEQIIFTLEGNKLTDNDYTKLNDSYFKNFIKSIENNSNTENNNKNIYQLIIKFKNQKYANIRTNN